MYQNQNLKCKFLKTVEITKNMKTDFGNFFFFKVNIEILFEQIA